jgi:hypothetical protein
MAKVPLPDRGQPLDVTYIYRMANAINEVADTVSTANNRYATIDTKSIGKQTFKIPDIRIYAGYTDVTISETVTAGQTVSKTIDYGATFAHPPIVTATVVNNDTNDAGNDATVVITSISTTSVTLKVRFSTAGSASVGVNVNIVGVPA